MVKNEVAALREELEREEGDRKSEDAKIINEVRTFLQGLK